MARRTVSIPDDLDDRVVDLGDAETSYSEIVQDALRDWVDKEETKRSKSA